MIIYSLTTYTGTTTTRRMHITSLLGSCYIASTTRFHHDATCSPSFLAIHHLYNRRKDSCAVAFHDCHSRHTPFLAACRRTTNGDL